MRGKQGHVPEQQSPKALPGQTAPLAPPQVPSVETFTVEVGRAPLETGEGVLQVPKPD